MVLSWLFGSSKDDKKKTETYHLIWNHDQYNKAREDIFQSIKPSNMSKAFIDAGGTLPKHCGKFKDSLDHAIKIFKKKEIKDCYSK